MHPCYNPNTPTQFDPWLLGELPPEAILVSCTNDSSCLPPNHELRSVHDRIRFRCSNSISIPNWLFETQNGVPIGDIDCTPDNSFPVSFARHCNCGEQYGFVGQDCSDLGSKGLFFFINCFVLGIVILGFVVTFCFFLFLDLGLKERIAASVTGVTHTKMFSTSPSRKSGKNNVAMRSGATKETSNVVIPLNEKTSSRPNKRRVNDISKGRFRNRLIVVLSITVCVSCLGITAIGVWEYLYPKQADVHTDIRMLVTYCFVPPAVMAFIQVNLLTTLYIIHIALSLSSSTATKKQNRLNVFKAAMGSIKKVQMVVRFVAFSFSVVVIFIFVISSSFTEAISNVILAVIIYFGFILFSYLTAPFFLVVHVQRIRMILSSNMSPNHKEMRPKKSFVRRALSNKKSLITSALSSKPSFTKLMSENASTKSKSERDIEHMIYSISVLCFRNFVLIALAVCCLAVGILVPQHFMLMLDYARFFSCATAFSTCQHIVKTVNRQQAKVAPDSNTNLGSSSVGTLTS